MSCNRLGQRVDAYLDGDLPAGERAELDEHLRGCAACGSLLAREQRLQRALRAQPVPVPTAGHFEQMLTLAVQSGSRRPLARKRHAMVGAALAAGLAVLAGVSFLHQQAGTSPATEMVASVTMTLHETRTVRLVFSAPVDMNEARLTLILPTGVELDGREGRQQVRWKTRLRRGKNVLPLNLVVRAGSGGVLLARLDHGDRHKIFRVRVLVQPGRPNPTATVNLWRNTA